MRGKILRTAILAALLAGVALTLTALASARHSQTGAVAAKKPAAHPSLSATGQRVRVTHRRSNPADVLYDQYNNPGLNATSSQNFGAAQDAFDDELGDD